jgi:hypothetical protein
MATLIFHREHILPLPMAQNIYSVGFRLLLFDLLPFFFLLMARRFLVI